MTWGLDGDVLILQPLSNFPGVINPIISRVHEVPSCSMPRHTTYNQLHDTRLWGAVHLLQVRAHARVNAFAPFLLMLYRYTRY